MININDNIKYYIYTAHELQIASLLLKLQNTKNCLFNNEEEAFVSYKIHILSAPPPRPANCATKWSLLATVMFMFTNASSSSGSVEVTA